MSASPSRRESKLAVGLLLACAIGCVGIADAARQLENANARRRAQLELLTSRLQVPGAHDGDALLAFDGLFARRLQQIATSTGPALAFAGDGSGGCP